MTIRALLLIYRSLKWFIGSANDLYLEGITRREAPSTRCIEQTRRPNRSFHALAAHNEAAISGGFVESNNFIFRIIEL